MIRVGALIRSPAVVKDREELYDFDVGTRFLCQTQPILQYPRPVRHSMKAVPGKGVFFENGVKDQLEIQCHGLASRYALESNSLV
jgi:hypothetical protein